MKTVKYNMHAVQAESLSFGEILYFGILSNVEYVEKDNNKSKLYSIYNRKRI